MKDKNITPKDFVLNGIYKMSVAKRSHVKKPYYVEVIEINPLSILTTIPNEHSLEICMFKDEWNYHIPRMTFIGPKAKVGHLLLNQKLK